MALGSTRPLTEMSTRNLPGSKGRPKPDNLTAICEPNVWTKCGSLMRQPPFTYQKSSWYSFLLEAESRQYCGWKDEVS
jgi:hypothetical protein